MSINLHSVLPNLRPYNYESHHNSLFINQQWVLVNGISKKKSVYTFKENNILEITRNDNTIITSWLFNIENVFTIKTEDGMISVKAYFKDHDILVLKQLETKGVAIYINTTNYSEDIDSVDDIQDYLKEKYKKKVSSVIYNHKFYYIEKSKEFGPYKVEELTKKVENDEISAYCFVRDINEEDYSKRLRIVDLINEL